MGLSKWHMLIWITILSGGLAYANEKIEIKTGSSSQTQQQRVDKQISVEVPWKVDGRMPKGIASIRCEFVNEQCIPLGGGIEKTFSVSANSSGVKTFNFSESMLKKIKAVDVICTFSAEGFGGTDSDSKSIFSNASRCTSVYDPYATGKKAEDYAAKTAADAEKRKQEAKKRDEAAQKAAQDFKNMRAGTKAARDAASRKNAEAAFDNKIAMNNAEVQRKFEEAQKKAEGEARSALDGTLLPCTTSKDCTVGSLTGYCDSYGQCRGQNIGDFDPNGDPCKYGHRCSNKVYRGICANNKCISEKRGTCEPGQIKECVSLLTDPTGLVSGGKGTSAFGTTTCQKNKYYGECKFSKSSAKAYNSNFSNYNKQKDFYNKKMLKERIKSGWTPTANTPCSGNYACRNKNFVGRCVESTGNRFRCKTYDREACNLKHSVSNCVNPVTGLNGMRICQPDALDDLRWGGCWALDEMDRNLPNW
jgi:hypothetical protein